MNGYRGNCCDPELIFEFVDGGLTPERRRSVRNHLQSCSECQRLYERELDLSSSLKAFDFAEAGSCSVSRQVAMALPTRPMKARILWALLAVALFAVASLALQLGGTDPEALATSVLGTFWGLASGGAGILHAVFSAIAPMLLVALGIGAFVDLLIGAAVVSASRRSRRA